MESRNGVNEKDMNIMSSNVERDTGLRRLGGGLDRHTLDTHRERERLDTETGDGHGDWRQIH